MGRTIIASMGIMILVQSGCASTPAKPQSGAQAGTVFAQPVARTQKAATDALVTLGFEIKKTEPLYVEGYRPHKVGAFVGSGGETTGVWLESAGADRTRVAVDTARSLVGFAGQRNWDSEILAEMGKLLSRGE